MRITPVAPGVEPFEISGDWLYKPDYKFWYVQPKGELSRIFSEKICEIIKEDRT